MLVKKKPVVVEAHQWFKNGDHPQDHDPIGVENPDATTLAKYEEYLQTEGKIVKRYSTKCTLNTEFSSCEHCTYSLHDHGWIDTLEGGHTVCPSDWIITGVRGEHYPIKDAIFRETYVEAPAETMQLRCPKCTAYRTVHTLEKDGFRKHMCLDCGHCSTWSLPDEVLDWVDNVNAGGK